MKHIPFYLLIALAIGCAPDKNYVAKIKLQKMTEADLYNHKVITDVVFDAQELPVDSLRNKSRQLFLKGADLYKNKKDASGAVSLFKQSILTFPDGKTYYELGNALVDSKAGTAACKEAVEAYRVAEDLDFKPKSMIYYKTAIAYNQMRKNGADIEVYYVVNNLSRAFENGFTDTVQLFEDAQLSSAVNSPEFKKMYLELDLNKLMKNNTGNAFDLFAKSFPEYKQPYEIAFENLQAGSDRQSISYEFSKFIPEMQNVSFGRDVSHDFFYVAKVAETPAYVALIYSSVNFYGEDMQPVSTKLVTFDHEGNIIAGKLFAGQFSAEKVKVGKIDNNEITLQDYKRIWKQPIDKVSFEDNEVEKYELIAKATFKLTDTGDIIEVSVPSNYMDSVVYAKK